MLYYRFFKNLYIKCESTSFIYSSLLHFTQFCLFIYLSTYLHYIIAYFMYRSCSFLAFSLQCCLFFLCHFVLLIAYTIFCRSLLCASSFILQCIIYAWAPLRRSLLSLSFSLLLQLPVCVVQIPEFYPCQLVLQLLLRSFVISLASPFFALPAPEFCLHIGIRGPELEFWLLLCWSPVRVRVPGGNVLRSKCS